MKEPRLQVNIQTRHGVFNLENPIGLAAGWDKDCKSLESLQQLGFGYLVGGTIMPRYQAGNKRPRVVRNSKELSLVNALGFPSQGLDQVLPTLQQFRRNNTKLVLSIAAVDPDEFINSYLTVQPWADAVELDISSPNTQGLQLFHEKTALTNLLSTINRKKYKPIFVKLPQMTDQESTSSILTLSRICLDNDIEGFTAGNTIPIQEKRLSTGRGGLSGTPIFSSMIKSVTELRKTFGPSIIINACGGISTPIQAIEALTAGASTIQLLTAFNYKGPMISKLLNAGILNYITAKNYSGVSDIYSSKS
jgi:dihydroorotate dehydrogenase